MRKGLILIFIALAIAGGTYFRCNLQADKPETTKIAQTEAPALQAEPTPAPVVAKATPVVTATFNTGKTPDAVPADCPPGHGYVMANPFRLDN